MCAKSKVRWGIPHFHWSTPAKIKLVEQIPERGQQLGKALYPWVRRFEPRPTADAAVIPYPMTLRVSKSNKSRNLSAISSLYMGHSCAWLIFESILDAKFKAVFETLKHSSFYQIQGIVWFFKIKKTSDSLNFITHLQLWHRKFMVLHSEAVHHHPLHLKQ